MCNKGTKKAFPSNINEKLFLLFPTIYIFIVGSTTFYICVKALLEKRLPKSNSLSMYLFLFSIFFLCRRTSPINHFLFIMADFRIHVVGEVGIVRFAKEKGICHLHQFTISGFGGGACRFQCSLHDTGMFHGALGAWYLPNSVRLLYFSI